MFVERLEQVADRIAGTVALALVARDGIPVESIRRGENVDLDLLAAELMSQVRAVSQNHRELAVGRVRQLSVTTDRLTLMVSSVTDDYYLMLVLDSDDHVGRARFELRRAVLLFEKDL